MPVIRDAKTDGSPAPRVTRVGKRDGAWLMAISMDFDNNDMTLS